MFAEKQKEGYGTVPVADAMGEKSDFVHSDAASSTVHITFGLCHHFLSGFLRFVFIDL